jgi:hypothetical protein
LADLLASSIAPPADTRLYYRCRFPTEYGLANKIDHPRNVYLAERDLLTPLDPWMSISFAPHQLPDTIHALYNAQPDIDNNSAAVTAEHLIQQCDAKLTRYRAALEAGTDPQLVTQWITEVEARRAEALARSHPTPARQRMSKDDITELIKALGNIPAVLAKAAPMTKPGSPASWACTSPTNLPNDSSGPKPALTPTVGVMDRVRGGIRTLFVAYLHRAGIHVTDHSCMRGRCG